MEVRLGFRSIGPSLWFRGEGGKESFFIWFWKWSYSRSITYMAQNDALLKQGSEVSVPEIVKKTLTQFLIQEVR